MVVVTPTDRPKSVRKRCVIKDLCCRLVVKIRFSVAKTVFVIVSSQIPFFFTCAWPFLQPMYRSFRKRCTLTNKAVGTIFLV